MSNSPFLGYPIFSWPAAPFGLMYSYESGSTTPKTTYSDAAGLIPNTNPVELDATGSATIRLGSGSYKFVLLDQTNTVTIWTADNYDPALQVTDITSLFTASYLGGFLYPQTSAETSAGVTPTSFAYPTLYGQRYGMVFDNSTDDTAGLNQAILVGSQTVNGALGAAVNLAVTGTSLLSSEITLPNRVRLLGYNKRGTYFIAKNTWNSGTSPWMFHAVNGTSSMFDSTLENLTVDCNNIAGLGGVLSDAWQDDCGLRGVLITNFTTSGVKFQNGYGGADQCKIVDTEIFGGTGASYGIDLTSAIGAVGGFTCDIQNSVIAGSGAGLTAGISCNGNSLRCIDVEFETCMACIIIDGTGFISLDDVRGSSSSVTTLVQIAATFTGTLIMKNCRRGGATNFLVDNRAGGYGTITGVDHPLLVIKGNNTEAAKGVPFASAWCYFDGTATGTNPPAVGFNVSSVTRNSAGNYTITLLRPMLSANGASVASCNSVASGISVATQLLSSVTFKVLISIAGTPTDENEVKAIIFGG